jgi:hypothetical protein
VTSTSAGRWRDEVVMTRSIATAMALSSAGSAAGIGRIARPAFTRSTETATA